MDNKRYFLGRIFSETDNAVLTIYIIKTDNNGIDFVDSSNNLIARYDNKYAQYSSYFATRRYVEDISTLKQIKYLFDRALENVEQSQDIIDTKEIPPIATLGIDEEAIKKVLEEDLDSSKRTVQEENNEKSFNSVDDIQLVTDNDFSDDREDIENTKQHNEEVLSHIGLDEIPLDRYVDKEHKLYEVLGVDDPQATLIPVHNYPSPIAFLIKHSDGTVEKADMLDNSRLGNSPDIEVHSADRKGEKLQTIKPISAFEIKNPANRDRGLISASYSSMGRLEFQYSKISRTNNNEALGVDLECNHDRYTTREAQDVIAEHHGLDHADEVTRKSHQTFDNEAEFEAEDKYKDENDSNISTISISDNPSWKPDYLDFANKILNERATDFPEIGKQYITPETLAKDLEKYFESNPGKNVEDFEKKCEIENEHISTIMKEHKK